MGTRVHIVLFGAIAVVVALVVSVYSGVGVAFAGCNPGRTNDGKTWFAGWVTNNEPSTVTVDTSNIYNYPNPYVYPGSGVFAWVMIVNDLKDYAQVGWVVDANGRHTFTEWNKAGQVGSDFSITAQTPGTTSWYEVYAANGSGTNYCFAVGGTQVGSCSGSLGWYGKSGQDLGEIHTLADQMPGAVTVPEKWSNAFIFYNGNQQYNFNGYGIGNNQNGGTNSYFNYYVYSQTVAEAGDKNCQS